MGEWINRLYERVQNLEQGTGIGEGGGTVDPNAPAPTKYTTGNLPLADAQKIGDWTAGAALPSLGDLQFQKDYNHWIYGAMANDSLRIDNIEGREKDYATRSWTQSWVANYYAPHDHKHPELAVDLTGYATEAWVTEQLAGINLPDGGGGGDVDLTGYATEAWVNEQGFIKAEELGTEMEPYAEKEWCEDKFVTYEVLEETAYSTARVSDKERAVWAGQKQVAPEPDPSGSIGWAYRSAGDGTKAHWTLWSQDRDAAKKLTLADVYSYSLVMTGKGQMPYLQVYTKRKNDGQDAASTYRSRISYELDGDIPAGLVTLALATSAPETPLYANLNRLILNRTQPRTVAEADLEVSPRFSVGPGEADEEISKVVLTTNSAAAEGDFDFMIASLVLHTKHGTYDTQLEFTGSGEEYDDTELVERIVALENDYTTTDDFNNLLKRTQENAKAIEAVDVKVTGNTSNIASLQDEFDKAVLELSSKEEQLVIELQGYAKKETTPTKEELTFVDTQYKLADENILKASQEADTALGELIQALQQQVKALEEAEPPAGGGGIDWENLPELK